MMSPPKRRGRTPVATLPEIERIALGLLVDHGPDAVTLRAIARELGVTAPALYRYYASRDELISCLRLRVCNDLAADLAVDLATMPEDGAQRLFAICRGFRRWALAHPREFTLVFASPAGGSASAMRQFDEPFGRIFLAAAGRVLTSYDVITPPADVIPPELLEDLVTFQTQLLAVQSDDGEAKFPVEKLDLRVTFLMMQIWARLYGHVTLEVFGNYPVPTRNPDVLFDSMLAALSREIGLST